MTSLVLVLNKMSDILYFWHAHWCSAAAATLLYLRNLQQKTEKKNINSNKKNKNKNKTGEQRSKGTLIYRRRSDVNNIEARLLSQEVVFLQVQDESA